MRVSLLICLLLLMSCSNIKRTVTVSSLIGGGVGAAGGYLFAPSIESQNKNAFIFGLGGAALAGILSYYIFKQSDPNENLKNMLLDEDINKKSKSINSDDLGLFDFSPELRKINPKFSFTPTKKYEVPIEKLPSSLRGKVKKQFIIEYESKEKTIQLGTRTIQIGPFKAWEHVYE